ncbi:MAG TPA: PAS domain S-box protein [Ktedonobacterales bacterium]
MSNETPPNGENTTTTGILPRATDEERFLLAVRGAGDGLWDWDLVADTVYYSPHWYEMLGIPVDAESDAPATLETWLARVHPADRERVLAELHAFAETPQKRLKLEHRVRHHNGRYRWMLVRAAARRGPDGRALRIAGWHTDVTADKRDEERLREMEARYRDIFESTSDALIITDLDGIVVAANPAAWHMHGYSSGNFVGKHCSEFTHPASYPQFAEFLQRCRDGGSYRYTALHIRHDSVPFPVEVHGSAFTYLGAPHALAVVRDISEREHNVAEMEQQVESRTQTLAALLDVSRSVASTLELGPVLRLILDHLESLVGYTGASVLSLVKGQVTVLDYRGPTPTRKVLREAYDAEQRAIFYQIAERRAPVILDDIYGDSGLAETIRTRFDQRNRLIYPYLRSWMSIPLIVKDDVIGLISLQSNQPGYYTDRSARIATAIAALAAIALENARLYEQAQDRSALEERQRLARELHDSVSQALYGIALGTRTARAVLERDAAQAREPLDYVLSLADTAMEEMRALILELRPESLEREGLASALRKLAEATHRREGLTVRAHVGLEPAISLEAKQAFYRIAQEALHNAVKHAQASRLDLTFETTSEAATLTVADDGTGFDPDGNFPGHLGLRSMRERITRLGGNLSITSAPGQGTTVQATLPILG